MTEEEHRERHILLHRMLDELMADWIEHTGGFPTKALLWDLVCWSHEQALNPKPLPHGRHDPMPTM